MINADDAAALDAITVPLVLTARSATVFRLPNRRPARPVVSGKLRRCVGSIAGPRSLSRRLIVPECECVDQLLA